MDEGALLSYCQALQAVIAGSAVPMVAQAGLSQTFQNEGVEGTTYGKQQASEEKLSASSPRISTDVLPASSSTWNESGVPVLDGTSERPGMSCSPNSAAEQAELLSWDSGSGSESSGEAKVEEDSESEGADESEDASMETEEASHCEEAEKEVDVDWDSYDAVEGFASMPSTPPRKERRDCETPPKLEAPLAFVSDDSDSCDSNSYPMGIHAKRTLVAFPYCNESDDR